MRGTISSVPLKRLRRILKWVGLVSLVLVVVLLANTFRKGKDTRPSPAPAPEMTVNDAPIAEHLAAAIRFKTVSHEDPAQDDTAELASLRAWVDATYPNVKEKLPREMVGSSLVYTWKGSDASLAPVLFAAHMDVVPIEPGTEEKWTHPPFSGDIAEGFVWGRGAMDDKSSFVQILEAAEALLASGFTPKRTIVLAFGHDEEVGGLHGAKEASAMLGAKGMHFAWAIDEGGSVLEPGLVAGVKRRVAVLGLGEKGYVSVELVAEGKAGHSSMPSKQTAIGLLSSAIDRLLQNQMKPHITDVSRRAFDVLGPEMPFGQRVAMANLWLLEPFVVSMLSSGTATNAIVRTTTAPTIIEGGVKDNVLPARARAVVNFRILTGDTVEGVLEHVRAVVNEPKITVKKLERMVSEPSPIASMTSDAYALFDTTIRQFFPDVLVMPNVLIGASDGRHYAPISDGVYHFNPHHTAEDDLPRIHGTNERYAVKELGAGVKFYAQLMRVQ